MRSNWTRYASRPIRYKGIFLINFGRFDEALAALRKAQTIQPLAVYISTNIGMVLYYAGRYQEALAQLELILRMGPRPGTRPGIPGSHLVAVG